MLLVLNVNWYLRHCQACLVWLNIMLYWQTSGFNIHGLRFEPGLLGHREICVKFREMTDYVRVDIVAGPPAKLTLPGWDVDRVCFSHLTSQSINQFYILM